MTCGGESCSRFPFHVKQSSHKVGATWILLRGRCSSACANASVGGGRWAEYLSSYTSTTSRNLHAEQRSFLCYFLPELQTNIWHADFHVSRETQRGPLSNECRPMN